MMDGTKPCKLARVISEYDPADLKTLRDWVNQRMPIERITHAIGANNEAHRMTAKTFRHHLIGQCSCPATAEFKGAWHES